MSARNQNSASDLLTPRRQHAGGVSRIVRPYPRPPFPSVAALLIDPTARTIRTVYVRATATGLRSIFGNDRVTFTDKPFLRAYGTNQYHEEITIRATLPNARLSVQGKVLITGPDFTDVFQEVAAQILKETTFSRCDAYEAQRQQVKKPY